MAGKWHLGHRDNTYPPIMALIIITVSPYPTIWTSLENNSSMDYWELWTKEYKNLTPKDFNVPI